MEMEGINFFSYFCFWRNGKLSIYADYTLNILILKAY